ncbi:hypothetical protein OC842_003633 [Tilletia horrida]|uniref:Uncharacterized protein n=1 Tax=Tilletia horrida TaxID=155126 RepID=A0AAN6JK97_9BASI|nr:hypothetical protein OC842_003633 [Tilletia horrida]
MSAGPPPLDLDSAPAPASSSPPSPPSSGQRRATASTLGYSPTLLLLSMTLCAFALHRLRNAPPSSASSSSSTLRAHAEDVVAAACTGRAARRRLRPSGNSAAAATRLRMHRLNTSSSSAAQSQSQSQQRQQQHEQPPTAYVMPDFSVPMRTRAAILADLPTTMADVNLCALASLSQWDSLPPGQYASASLAQAAAVRMQQREQQQTQQDGRALAAVQRVDAGPSVEHSSAASSRTQPRSASQRMSPSPSPPPAPHWAQAEEATEDGQAFQLSAEHLRPSSSSSAPERCPGAGREAELELELRKTRDELEVAKAWMREACERVSGASPRALGSVFESMTLNILSYLSSA